MVLRDTIDVDASSADVFAFFEDMDIAPTVRVLDTGHWTVADREAHEKIGFHEGCGKRADQLAALVARL